MILFPFLFGKTGAQVMTEYKLVVVGGMTVFKLELLQIASFKRFVTYVMWGSVLSLNSYIALKIFLFQLEVLEKALLQFSLYKTSELVYVVFSSLLDHLGAQSRHVFWIHESYLLA